MRDPDRIVREAETTLRRVSDESRARAHRVRLRRNQRAIRIAQRLALAFVGVVVVASLVGFRFPIGPQGFGLALFMLMLLWGAILWFSTPPEATREALVTTDLAALPAQTEAWLAQQRPALPAPAVRLVDAIGIRLDALGPQLDTLDPREPAAAELRKLMAEELPELVAGYRRVPESLRSAIGAGGVTPDRQLADGLAVVESELARMTAQLASGDLHQLATQGRYLELKYRGDDAER